MKIIRVDNFQRESPNYPDMLIAEKVHWSYISDIVRFLNDRDTDAGNDNYCYRQVEDNYELKDYSPV